MPRKIFLSIISVFLMFLVLEWGAGKYWDYQLRHFPEAPDSADGFGSIEKLFLWSKVFGYLQQHVIHGSTSEYHPYTVTLPKPNLDFVIKNIEAVHNSYGLRDREVEMPKPKDRFRVFILGGSTVYGIFNDKWIISRYLEPELKKKYPNVEVFNAGVTGYHSQKELALLTTSILDLEPDLILVLDGRNDLYYSIRSDWDARKDHDFFDHKAVLDGLVNYPTPFSVLTYTTKYLVKRSSFLSTMFRLMFRGGGPGTYPEASAIKDESVRMYLDNWDTMRAILEAKGVHGAFFFQPTLGYCKPNVTAYEESITTYLRDVEKSSWITEVERVWPEVARKVSNLKDSSDVKFYDAACLFKDTKETAYVDSVHYSPLGAEMIGKMMSVVIERDFMMGR